MSAVRAQRRSAVRPARRSARPKRRRSSRRRGLLRHVVVLTALAVAALLAARQLGLFSQPPRAVPAGSHLIRYSVVAGDTPSSIAASFAVDANDVAGQAGMSDLHAPLGTNTAIRIDASQLWQHLSTGPLAGTEALVVSTARRFGIEPALGLAVAWQESKLDESARSNTGAVGIMQVEPDTSSLAARDLGMPIDPRDTTQNVMAGMFWLHSLLSSYGGDQTLALAAYYEGPGNLARNGYLPGTGEYVARARQLRDALIAADPGLNS